MTQLAFDLTAPEPRRRGVQRTSVDAALMHQGKLDKRVERAVVRLSAYCQRHEAPTSLELATWSWVGAGDWTRHLLDVRIGLADAKRQGFVVNGEKRRCTISGLRALTWRGATR